MKVKIWKKQYSFDIPWVCRNTFYFIGTPLFFEKKAILGPKTAFPNFFFPFWGGAFWEPFVSNTYIPLFQVYFHHTGCPKEWKCNEID